MILETEKLLLRPFESNDLEDLAEYLSQIKVHCFLEMKPKTKGEAIKQLNDRVNSIDYFAVVLKENNKVIGEVFSHEDTEDAGSEFEHTFSPCWILNEDYQHKGYMFEAVKAYFDYLFKERQARRIYAYTEDYNLASQNLCKKLGMRKEAEFKEFIHFTNDEKGNPIFENTIEFAILSKEWAENKTSEH